MSRNPRDIPADGRRGASRGERRIDVGLPLRASDPARVNGYRLVSRLGTGGMANVFSALAPNLSPVALKLFQPARGGPDAAVREYGIASRVPQRYTARPLDYGVSPSGAYLVSEFLSGYRSASALSGRNTSATRLWAFGTALAGTLAAIHAENIVHCDVKPSNLLIHGLDVRLIDFGISRYAGEADGDLVRCSRGWAAPEQLRAARATPAMDVFSWGCVLAYLGSGFHPFGSSEDDWLERVQSADPELTGLPPALKEVIAATLVRDPAARPSAAEIARICRRYAARDSRSADRLPGYGRY